MKKILILSYFFSPCNLTASQRSGSWAKYLQNYGFYPIVVTRKWKGDELTESDRLESTTDDIEIKKEKNHEIHYLPYKSSLRDKWFIKRKDSALFAYASKFLTAINMFAQNFFISTIPYHNLYLHTQQILKNNSDVRILIISGNPFEQFFFGYLLKKEFPDLKWVADYRDDWNTTEIGSRIPIISWFENISEKKWVKSASYIISVSPYYVKKISNFVGVKGKTIFNGYDFDLPNTNITYDKDSFKIVYNGTLYPSQDIAVFLEGYKQFVTLNHDKKIHLYFPGLALLPEQVTRVEDMLKGFEKHYSIYDRIPKNEVLKMQLESDCLLMISHKKVKGIPSSKIFEYIGLAKDFIVCPGDNDILDEIAQNSQFGTVLNTEIEVVEYLVEKLREKKYDSIINRKIDIEAREKYSVKNQVKELAKILKEL